MPSRTDARYITVLMPVYNGERYLAVAIESILAQTHARFELLIVDDGSTDATPEILASYAARDPRIRVYHHPNCDQPKTLNRGLALARHDWVAILDHDDISLPRRLERQIAVLARQPEARVIGSYAIEINAAGRELRLRNKGPSTVTAFRALHAAGLRVPLVHPSVLMHRPTILDLGGYDPAFGSSADTELWTRVAERHPIIVVPEPLVYYRIHGESMSFHRMFEQREMLRWIEVRDRARRRGEPPPSLDELRARQKPTSAARWRDLRRDLFWYFRSYCLLALSERNRLSAAGFAICAALVGPSNALRLLARVLLHRNADAT
jgi:glycosyltransferase involved in cell wall biosynthesis